MKKGLEMGGSIGPMGEEGKRLCRGGKAPLSHKMNFGTGNCGGFSLWIFFGKEKGKVQ